MKRIAYAIVLLMFLAGSTFAVGCGGGEEEKPIDLSGNPAGAEDPGE